MTKKRVVYLTFVNTFSARKITKTAGFPEKGTWLCNIRNSDGSRVTYETDWGLGKKMSGRVYRVRTVERAKKLRWFHEPFCAAHEIIFYLYTNEHLCLHSVMSEIHNSTLNYCIKEIILHHFLRGALIKLQGRSKQDHIVLENWEEIGIQWNPTPSTLRQSDWPQTLRSFWFISWD